VGRPPLPVGTAGEVRIYPVRGGFRARCLVRDYDGKVGAGTDPMGRTHFWFTVVPIESVEEATDRWAIERGYVSMTPLRLDLTDEKALGDVEQQHPLATISFA